MDKKKGIFFGAIIIDIILIYLAYLVFYEKPFDESISVILTWIVIIGLTFMMIITIGLAIFIPRKKHIKFRRRRPTKETSPEEVVEDEIPNFKVVEDEEIPKSDSVEEKIVEKHDLEYVTSDSGTVNIRRVAKEDLDEIKEHVNDEKNDFKDEMQKVIDARTQEVERRVDNLLAIEQTSKMEDSVVQNESTKPLKQKIRGKLITNEDKIYNYLKEHPDATTSEVRKAVGCKLSSAKRYRSLWLKHEGN
jgi:hypothetical protein